MSDRDNKPFNIPSILATNEIKDGKGPLLFSSAKLPHRDGEVAKDTVVGSGELPTSSVVGETVGEPSIAVGGASPYHPHAIIANGQQVGLLQWVDLDYVGHTAPSPKPSPLAFKVPYIRHDPKRLKCLEAGQIYIDL